MRYSVSPATLVLAALGACSESGSPIGPSDPGAATAATQLVAVSPPGNATGVAPTTLLTLQFDGAMMPGMEQFVDLHRGDVSGPTHPIACSWSADRAVLTCTPGTPLEAGTRYTLHLGGGMRGSDGTPVHMDPARHAGAWVNGGAGGQPMAGGGMHAATHAGHRWASMSSGWQHANGSYGIACPFQTG